MKITQIRNATLRIDYGGVRFLIDPMLGEQSAYPPFADTPNDHLCNPLVPLLTPMSEILDVDAAWSRICTRMTGMKRRRD